ncbi:3-deoxy-D-manno-octulosonic acid transferase, partial [Candidatus Pelagibacter sp.]|nr:3-deoxy-D-manno-octulosonic acid transferase [Candidatus Pelagibacter sp.]
MIIVYRFLINLIFFLSPLILFYRFVKKKEDPIRFKEKFGFFKKKRKKGKLIWFHGASVGELQSV